MAGENSTSPMSAKRADLRPWICCVLLFYAAWTWLMFWGDSWLEVLHHWPIALAMVFGSYVAGSTPMGGGTVAFPVLTLLLGEAPSIGRHFSFAVQATGMVSASLFILCRRRPLAWTMLAGAIPGALIGMPLGTILLAPWINDLAVRLTFAVLWASFGVVHVIRFKAITAPEGPLEPRPRLDLLAGFIVGLVGAGTVAAITGVGVETLLYLMLVLWRRADVALAIPTAVVLAAFTSVVGLATSLALGQVERAVYLNWLAATPIVVIGAPIGALMMTIIPRAWTLMLVSMLCLGQFAWTCLHQRVQGGRLAAALLVVAVVTMLFLAIDRMIGRRQAKRRLIVSEP